MHVTRRCALLLLGTSACSSPAEPSATVTVLVTNETCRPGPCTAIRILGFPGNQPNTPGGLWSLDLGLIVAPSACLTLPSTSEFRVTNTSTGAATIYAWTTGDAISLGAIAESSSRLQASPSTPAFVPTSARGWSVSLPSGTRLSATDACKV